MSNLKMSEFTEDTTLDGTEKIAGYLGADNIQFTSDRVREYVQTYFESTGFNGLVAQSLTFGDGTRMTTAAATSTGQSSTGDLNFAADSDIDGSGEMTFAVGGDDIATMTNNGLEIKKRVLDDGWSFVTDVIPTRTYNSAPEFNLTYADIDLTDDICADMKLKLTQDSTVRYFYVMKVYTSGDDTIVVINGGDDYDVEDTGTYTISDAYYSRLDEPQGWVAPWIDYGADSTLTGWSSTTTEVIRYKKRGDIVFVSFNINGTSDSTDTSFTLPYTAIAGSLNYGGAMALAMNNGTYLTVASRIHLSSDTSIVNLYTDMALGVWTNSGQKLVRGSFWYVAADL